MACTFVVFFKQLIHLKESLQSSKIKRHRKIITYGRSKKDPREEEKLLPLLFSSNSSSISQKNFIHQSKKYIEKNLNVVEEKNIREQKIHKKVVTYGKSKKDRTEEENLLPLLFS